ncbi:proteasome activator complex subunit 4-like isoform X2 [Planococcus citri]|uniref:proteasome activator complex subunit 4-like isoform X2 n=1 Tax=Planococcus citri TaxID=170843 RepID=UPI0031F7E66C
MYKNIKFQKDNQKLKLLPYGDELDEEAYEQLRQLKTYFGSSILLREPRQYLIYWNARLLWYVHLYGLKFTKEDHVLFIQILYEMATRADVSLDVIPDYNSSVHTMLCTLLRKRRLLVPGEDLTLPWRPLYNICKRIFWCSQIKQAIMSINPNVKYDLELIVNTVRYYFPPESTKEILEELRPYLCPFDTKAMKFGIHMLSLFLPLSNRPELADVTHNLWFEELMQIWDVCSNNCFFWEDHILHLISTLAWVNVGRIDWEKYMPIMYSRFLKVFKLPVHYKKTSSLKLSKVSEESAASWIVSTLGGESKSQDYLEQLLKILESYCHPANTGYWVSIIKSFLKKLVRNFVLRVKRERFAKPSWDNNIPPEKKLTDEDIRRFVVSVQSVAMQAVFSPSTVMNFAVIFNDLATLRPDIVVPPLLDTFYATVDSLTEPYKLISALQSICGVARPMLSGGLNCTYEGGKNHVIPLLFAILPGIDPNDMRKSIIALQLICTFSNMIPLVDCSSASSHYSDLTPEEEELASATSQFEEFVLQFFDRIFLLIESIVQENVRIENNIGDDRNKDEQSVYDIMWLSCHSLVGQLSSSIFMEALKKLYNYSITKIFEREVAGQAIASMIRAFAKVNGEETFKLFLPNLCSFVIEQGKNQDLKNEEILDDELLYKMMLVSEIVLASPNAIKPYLPMLQEMLDLTLHLKCKEGYEISTRLLAQLLILFSTTYPTEYRSSTTSYDDISENLPLKEWGKTTGINNLNIKWYTPSEEEISIVEQIFWKYLMPELETIDKYVNNEIELSRENLRATLTIIFSLFSCSTLLDPWRDEPPLKLSESQLPVCPMTLKLGVKRYIRMPDGSNVYKVLMEKMALLQNKLLKESDDTISFILLINIWSDLLYYDESLESDYKVHKDGIKMPKMFFENRLIPSKRNVRFMLIEEMALKHMFRCKHTEHVFTESHKIAIMKILELATSDYKPVQSKAQKVLHKMLRVYYELPFVIKDQIVENLKGENKFSEKYKSTLAILKGQRRKEWPMLLQSMDTLQDILPALVNSVPNEEPAVVKLLSDVTDTIVNNVCRFSLKMQMPNEVVEKAKELWSHSEIEMLHELPSDEQIQKGSDRLQKENSKVTESYLKLLKSMLEAAESKTLHWRYELMAVSFLALFLSPEEPIPVEIVRFFLKLLLHDSVILRKMAIKCVVCIMKITKRKAVREKVNPFAIKNSQGDSSVPTKPGPRPDNSWCLYHENNVPKNETEWNEARYTYSCYIGYYCWPKELYLHSSSATQPMNTLKDDEFTAVNKEVDAFFRDTNNIDKLIKYLSLEESKGQPLKYFQIALFKYIFKVHGDRYFEILKPHVERLADDQQDGCQRCAAEMLAGIIQGTKLWPYEKSQCVTKWCADLLKKSLDNVTVETQKNWGTAIASALYNCDVNKSHHLLEALMDAPIKGDASFKDCGRLFSLQGGGMYSWRLGHLWTRLLEDIKPHLANQYQNLRERLGSVLVSIFETDVETDNWNRTCSPRASEFIEYLLPRLEILYSVAPNSKANPDENGTPNGDEMDIDSDKEIQEAIQLLKTVCKWCTYSIQRCVYQMKPEFFKICPLVCYMENYDNDDELKEICKGTLSLMSFSIVHPQDVPIFIEAIEKVSQSNSWCTKCTGLDFLQVFVFHNVFIISTRQEWITRILIILGTLLEDDRCEVRQKAGEVISGFIHYNIIKETQELLDKFKKMRKKPLNKKSNINIRHAGVIGLCSFINAHPYTVPPEVPELFVEIGDHLGDPEPIPSTIRKTLGNFKRTHYADWNFLKTQFTADQMDVFIDISVPPNHYA